MNVHRIPAALAATLSLTGCAELQFSDSPKEGFVPFSVQRTYVVVNTAANCDRTGSIVVMNDLEHTYYVRPKGGYGNYNLTAKFDQGVLTTFGNQNDTTKLPDAVSTVLGAVGLSGAAAKPASNGAKTANFATGFEITGLSTVGGSCAPSVEVYALGQPGSDGKTYRQVNLPPGLASIVTSPKPATGGSGEDAASDTHTRTPTKPKP